MPDLIEAFFQRDLSEAEQESLGGLLGGSLEAVLRYENLLEKNYLATGLPLPSLPQGLQNLPHPGSAGWSGGSALAKILLAGLVGAGVVAWEVWPRPQALVPVQTTAPAMKYSRVPAQAPLAKAVTEPAQPEPAKPSAEGEELSVVVDSSRSALVTVRILDQAGREVRALYAGFVQPGRKTFSWDGLLADGQPAPAGDYRIDVVSGSSRQTKDIKIRVK